jgi:hypothetical protein
MNSKDLKQQVQSTRRANSNLQRMREASKDSIICRITFSCPSQTPSRRIANLKQSSELFSADLKINSLDASMIDRGDADVQSRVNLSISSQLTATAKSSSQVQRKINFLVLSKVVYYTDMSNSPPHTTPWSGATSSSQNPTRS